MLNAASEVLYVGKARNLKARVANYARPSGHSARIARMIHETASMMFLTTRTEVEALLLEQNLIKQLKPRYNVLMRDDNSFPNILIGKTTPSRRSRSTVARKRRRQLLRPLRQCGGGKPHAEPVAEGVPAAQLLGRDAGKPHAPLPAIPDQALQRALRRQDQRSRLCRTGGGRGALSVGKSTTVQADLAKAMAEASEAMEFERAAALRDRIRALTAVQSAQGINPRGVPEADVIAVHLDHGQACVQVFFIRANQSWATAISTPAPDRRRGTRDPSGLPDPILRRQEPPRLILLSHTVEDPDLVAEALSARAGRKVELTFPSAAKRPIWWKTRRNARESLARRMAETGTQAKLLQGLVRPSIWKRRRNALKSMTTPISRADAVGGMVVAGPEASSSRNTASSTSRAKPGANSDDFGMMKEVLSRRFDRC